MFRVLCEFYMERVTVRLAPGTYSFSRTAGFRLKRYSRISSVNLFFSFIPAALMIVRIELAVRPCFPITLPRSSEQLAIQKPSSVPPSMSRTEACSGLSTRAFAICSMSSFIAPPTSFCALLCRRGVFVCPCPVFPLFKKEVNW